MARKHRWALDVKSSQHQQAKEARQLILATTSDLERES